MINSLRFCLICILACSLVGTLGSPRMVVQAGRIRGRGEGRAPTVTRERTAISPADRTRRYVRCLVIGQRRHAGQSLEALRWQSQFMRGALAARASESALLLGQLVDGA